MSSIQNRTPRLIPILFEKNICTCDKIEDRKDYLIKFKNRWHGGRFEKFIYGWVFMGIYTQGCRLDMDGWEKIYEIQD
jgi:hypothetical protein